MLVPLSWLREFTPFEGSASELGDKLTMLGLELEEIVNPFAAIEDIVVGYVAQCESHPDSDHMHCCKVDIGSGELLDIVCGAPNVAEGQKVAVAPVGARLPDGTVIKKAKLRGKPSFGMICSERELGLSDDHSGIMILPEHVIVGHKLVKALNMDTEVLDISVTPNRPDCLSIIGMARETAMAFNLPLGIPELPVLSWDKEHDIKVPVQIDDPDLCWLYSGRVITGVSVAPSPMSIRYRLLAVGVRPISNIVDITNYILFETGQPLHSFDLDKLEGGKIIVRRAKQGELFTTLDGKERTLEDSDLCICDEKRAVGLAGVMGGLNTEIDKESRNVFLESAVFNPVNIRKTSRRLGLVSEASFRFERGVDMHRTLWALQRACALMESIGGGFPVNNLSVENPRPFIAARIPFVPEKADALLGVKIASERQREILSNLGCAVEDSDQSCWTVIQPSWRPDLTREADLIEEVGRVYGLDTIPPELPTITCDPDLPGLHSQYVFLDHIRHWGAGLGLNEAVNYSFVGQQDLDFLNLEKEHRIAIYNPLSEDQNVLRTCLAPGLLQAMRNNLAFGAQSIKLFEIANAFAEDKTSQTGARETPLLGIILHGLRHEPAWPHVEAEMGYADLKGIIENLVSFMRLEDAAYAEDKNHPFLSPCVRIKINNMDIGVLGRIIPQIAKKYNASKGVWLAELNLQVLRTLREKAEVRFHSLPVYPPVRRDITVMAAAGITAENILENIFLMKIPLLEGAVLIDCYEPQHTGERNLTFRLTFRHPDRTLKDAEVDKEREKVAEFLRTKLNVRI